MNILITGGTGFFAKGFVKTLLEEDLATRICIYSRGEFAQATMRREFKDDERLRWFIGDVRDQDRLYRAMSGCEVVVHAAALKRVEVAEYNPLECISTNVQGTVNVVKAAIDARIKKAVFLSTDKAFEPCNTYGLSKALAEKVFLGAGHYAGDKGPAFAVTRYGNVAGSTGSVIPTWRELMKTQSHLPVTDPEATRFWMTRQQAVDLVLWTLDTMTGGELNIPTLPAYRLGDLAVAMNPGRRPKIIGLGKGEKLHESMASGKSSADAERLTVDELREALAHV